MGSEFALVLAADEGFALPLAVAMRSALANLSALEVEVYVLDNGLSEASRARLLKVVSRVRGRHRLQWLSVPAERLANIAIGEGHFTVASYSRLLAPELVPENTRRMVYLDADVLVRGDLGPLFAVDLGEAAPAGAVRDFAIPNTAHELSGVRDPVHDRPYYNAGVLLIDVSRWRSAGLTDRLLNYATAGPEPLPWVDQDALNAVVESWHELDYKWNVQTDLFWGDRRPRSGFGDDVYAQRGDLYRSAVVLHFVGGPKPWHPFCTLPGTTAWVWVLIRTGWYPRTKVLAWVLRYLRIRTRYWLGTTRSRWRARLASRNARDADESR